MSALDKVRKPIPPPSKAHKSAVKYTRKVKHKERY